MTKKNGHLVEVVNKDQVIVLYKRGSLGEVVAIYDTVLDIVFDEKFFNSRFKDSYVYRCLYGNCKSFTSLKYQCKIVPRLKNRSEIAA